MKELINVKNSIDDNNLVFAQRNGAYTSSVSIAEYFGKRHKDVLEKIDQLNYKIKNLAAEKTATKLEFKEQTYIDERGKTNRCYFMNRDAFTLLVMGFSGEKSLKWKIKYITAFNKMEDILIERKTKRWEEQRLEVKITRKLESDQIQIFVNYAKSNGSKNADKYYTHFSNMANKYAQINNRDFSDFKKLKNLEIIENVIKKELTELISKEYEYHKIFDMVKKRVALIAKYL